MCPKGNDRLGGGCKKIELNKGDRANVIELSCPRNSAKRSSELSSTIGSMPESSLESLVFKRRKLGANSDSRTLGKGRVKSKRSGDCISSVSCKTCVVEPKEKRVSLLTEHDTEAIMLEPLSLSLKSKTQQGSIGSERLVDKTHKGSVQILMEIDSGDDSCSSSKSFVDQVRSSNEVELDEASDCSSSSVATVMYAGEDLSEKEFCISILRSHGLLSSDCSSRSSESAEDTTDNYGTCFRSCKICNLSETATKLLICDNCEDAFHMFCCKPRIKKVPDDEWFCQSCVKKGCKTLKEKGARKFPRLNNELSGSLSSQGRTNTIGLMLRRNEPYTTSVRIGKAFQAEVPDWHGPMENDDNASEPIEMDPSEYLTFHEFNPDNTSVLGTLNNWLQCQGALDVSEGDLKNGNICGKWRRAPLFEVQTDDWECFCSVRWDPRFADCAVPQEITTDRVLRQLKPHRKGVNCLQNGKINVIKSNNNLRKSLAYVHCECAIGKNGNKLKLKRSWIESRSFDHDRWQYIIVITVILMFISFLQPSLIWHFESWLKPTRKVPISVSNP